MNINEKYPNIEYIKNPIKFWFQEALETIIKFKAEEDEFYTVIIKDDNRFPTLYDEIMNGDYCEVTYQPKPSEEDLIERKINSLRRKRTELFRYYVDKSQLFYDDLSTEDLDHVKNWRQIWKDMPQAVRNGTWVEPEIPPCFK